MSHDGKARNARGRWIVNEKRGCWQVAGQQTQVSETDGSRPSSMNCVLCFSTSMCCAQCLGFDYMQTKFTHSVLCASFSCIMYSVSVYSGSVKGTQRTWEVEVSLAQTTLPPPSLLPLYQVRVFRQSFIVVFYAFCLYAFLSVFPSNLAIFDQLGCCFSHGS